eukprot:TRINITY_DN34159_c0_g1_i8.p1 TRINITY_DN34159_c0_g1~~TRINITY_DN34159_c0_g1_i8.p1  ORF type:complete len:213 (+),score=-20.48 TRINITY_DN34159_c0_g1_i8:265-903(+)
MYVLQKIAHVQRPLQKATSGLRKYSTDYYKHASNFHRIQVYIMQNSPIIVRLEKLCNNTNQNRKYCSKNLKCVCEVFCLLFIQGIYRILKPNILPIYPVTSYIQINCSTTKILAQKQTKHNTSETKFVVAVSRHKYMQQLTQNIFTKQPNIERKIMITVLNPRKAKPSIIRTVQKCILICFSDFKVNIVQPYCAVCIAQNALINILQPYCAV